GVVDELVSDPPSLRLIGERWPDADVPAAARPDGQRLLDALAGSEADTVPVRVERLNRALAPLIRSVYADGELRLVDLEQLVGAAAGAASVDRAGAPAGPDPPPPLGRHARPAGLGEVALSLSTPHRSQ